MIEVFRDSVQLSVKEYRKLGEAHDAVKAFYRIKETDRSQLRPPFPSDLLGPIRERLKVLFADTCAYCETSSEQSELLVDRFRPISEAADLDGTSYPQCYWRLAYNWDNLLLACTDCIHNRGNRFPIVGSRAETATSVSGANLLENPFLIDPTVDHPTSFLRFFDSGQVEPYGRGTNSKTNIQRGGLTIELFGLNRSDLVLRRESAIKLVAARLERFSPTDEYKKELSGQLFSTLEEIVDENSSYVAAKRHFVARYLLANEWMHSLVETSLAKAAIDTSITLEPYIEVEKKAPPRFKAGLQESIATEVSEVLSSINYDSYYIKRIEIENFRSIGKLDLNLVPEKSQTPVRDDFGPKTDQDTSRVGWKMILGENGAGKSSVLKALALALMGEELVRSRKLDPKQILNRNSSDKSGLIKISLSKGDPIEIRLTESSIEFASGAAGATGLFLRGYGSARLFKKTDDQDLPLQPAASLQRLENLFSPHELLANPTESLRTDQSAIDSLGLSLRDLLNLPDRVTTPLSFDGNDVLLDTGNGPTPLAEQSDGYKSVLAFVVDIFSGLSQTTRDKSTLAGIVLIDEIDSHLHPTWKMRIVSSLRKTFPRIQFIATTHEPLCLRGLDKGEITLLRKVDGGTEIIDDLPSVADLRVDQLLTSELFGLSSTIDPTIDEMFHNYYALLARSTPTVTSMPAAARRRATNKLRNELSRFNTLGFTRRDQLVYDLVDEFLAKNSNKPKSEQTRLFKTTKQKVFDIWEMIDTGGDLEV